MDATGQGSTMKVVRMFDPAVRWSQGPRDGHTDAHEYRKRRGEVALVTIDGQRPAYFHTVRLRRSETRDVESVGNEVHANESAFALGVTLVEMPDGRSIRPANRRWTDDELDQFDFIDINDIGSFIRQRSVLPLGWSGTYAAPLSSGAALVALLSRSVAQSPPGAPSSSSAPEER